VFRQQPSRAVGKRVGSRELRLVVLALPLFVLSGCWGGAGRVPAADVDFESFVESLTTKYDRDANGQLSSDELATTPYLWACMKSYDANKDGQLAADEIVSNLSRVFNGKLALMGATCRVTRNGKPLDGAIVYFVPLPGLEDELPVAGAVTRNGAGTLSIRPEDLPKNSPKVKDLMRPGLYFVEVTHPTIQIPEQYNVKTTFGQEVTPDTADGPYDFALKF
jgi:hypothetical protein